MHEFSLLRSIFTKLDELQNENQGKSIKKITIKLGALSHISAEHFKEHFDQLNVGKPYVHAQLDLVVSNDQYDPNAQQVLLQSIEVEG